MYLTVGLFKKDADGRLAVRIVYRAFGIDHPVDGAPFDPMGCLHCDLVIECTPENPGETGSKDTKYHNNIRFI